MRLLLRRPISGITFGLKFVRLKLTIAANKGEFCNMSYDLS